jgi:hypothetical protein
MMDEHPGLIDALRRASGPQSNGEYLDTAQLTQAAADEIERLSKMLNEIRQIEDDAFSLRDCDVGMTKIRNIFNPSDTPPNDREVNGYGKSKTWRIDC